MQHSVDYKQQKMRKYTDRVIKTVVAGKRRRRIEMNAIMTGETTLVLDEDMKKPYSTKTKINEKELAVDIAHFKKSLKGKNLLEESTQSSLIGLDKFGRKIDPVLEEYKKRSIRPRELLDAK